MKKFWKITLSSLTVLAFLLIALATSTEDDYFIATQIEGYVYNVSDSCDLTGIRFTYEGSNNNEDTLQLGVGTIPPGDSNIIYIDSLAFRELLYICSCPGDTAYLRSIPMNVVSGEERFERLEAGCD